MNRPLVLSSEHAGHPFRRTLPPRVTRALPSFEPEVLAAIERAEVRLRSPDVDPQRVTRQDVKDFLLAYFACFMAVILWIA
ncbi:MAG: hypothetical protein KGL48_14805 [Sphingomonadales bacterium]|nr:hypothetical protein [Sphingomonadales bacterium]MDE2570572.1 hypothetical protein [Sphingomonadales bacterium]